jgi:ABC-type transport system involved in Fe-S cluster assembly fused permease/ATPase subunit
MERAMGKINFLRRGIILILIGSLVLIVGLALYFELNTGATFRNITIGFSIPFFFIGFLLLRWHSTSKRKKQEPSSQTT